MDKTLFQRIIDREIPATIEYEDDLVIAIRDIAPSAPTHLLVIPKKPIPSVNDLTDDDAPLVGHVFMVAKTLAARFNVDRSGYRVVTNVNADAGQTVFHLHFHVLGGSSLGRMNNERPSATPSEGHGGHSDAPSTPAAYRAGVVSGGIAREGGILLLAAIGLALVFNAMNPKAITWMKKDFEHVEASDSDLAQYLTADTTTANSNSNSQQQQPTAHGQQLTANSSQPTATANSSQQQLTANSSQQQLTANSSQQQLTANSSQQQQQPAFTPQPGLVREITYDAFVKFLKQPHYLIDARRPEAYAEGYIADAKNIYGGEVQGIIPMILEMVPRDRVIMIYCDGGDECELSHHVADVLKQFEYGPIFIYKGGWNEWILKKR